MKTLILWGLHLCYVIEYSYYNFYHRSKIIYQTVIIIEGKL